MIGIEARIINGQDGDSVSNKFDAVFSNIDLWQEDIQPKVDSIEGLAKKADIVNLVGNNAVQEAIKEGLVHPEAVIYISGIPHAQVVKL